jgi:phage portal protein BeeE
VRLFERLLGRQPERSVFPAMSLNDYASIFSFNGNLYPITSWGQPDGKNEGPAGDFAGYAEGLYKKNGAIAALLGIRLALFSQAWPMWQNLASGRPGDLFSNPAMQLLREPWPNGTSSDLLARMIQDVDLGGNFYGYREGSRIVRLRPDWVDIVTVGEDPDVQIAGYLYRQGGDRRKTVTYVVDEVAHWCPLPDPTARFRGMSWLTPVVREVMADGKMTEHKSRFLDNAATPNLVVKYPPLSPEEFETVKKLIDEGHSGTANAYKTLHISGGADVTVVGANFQQLDFKLVQGAGETRLAAAAGVPPVIVGFSEGLAGSSLNAGNYAMARRRLADGTLHPLWGSAFGALQRILPRPPGSAARLWYDASQIPFLREDLKDQADISQIEALSIRQLVDAGYTPDAAVAAVVQHDMRLLAGSHSGLFSVQLQAPGSSALAPPARALAAVREALALPAATEEAP